VAALVCCIATWTAAWELLTLGALGLALSIPLAMWSYGRPRRVGPRVRARVEGKRLYVGARLLVGAIRTGRVIPSARDGVFVRLREGSEFGVHDLRVDSIEEGRALLAALGVDPRRSVSKFRVRAPSLAQYVTRTRLAWISAAAFIASLLALPSFGWAGALLLLLVSFLAFCVFALSLTIDGEATVGRDGIAVRWLWARRFLPLADVAEARAEASLTWIGSRRWRILLCDASGATLRELFVATQGRSVVRTEADAELEDRVAALTERIRDAIATRGAPTTVTAEALDRGTRTTTEWLTGLRALRERQETFRDGAPPDAEALFALIEDPTVPPSRRVAAAIGLGAPAQGEVRRLRVAAKAAASPRLRLALEAVASGKDGWLEKAIEAVEEESREARR
jgi:hypothetical protein